MSVSLQQPNVVNGKILQSEKILDDSEWIEIARYEQYSLIIRVQPLFNRMEYFDNNKQYCGYSDSHAQTIVNRWFENLEEESVLKKYAVGNDANLNMGCFNKLNETSFYDVNKSKRKDYEAMGTGFCLPTTETKKSAFLLSFQEAEEYISFDGNNKQTLPSINYHKLKNLVISKTGQYENNFIGDNWLRTPGKYDGTCSYFGEIFLTGSINCKDIKQKCFIRPCIWIDSNVFNKENICLKDKNSHKSRNITNKIETPIEELLEPLDSMVGMTNFKETVRKILLKEKTNYFDRKSGIVVENSSFHMVLTGDPGTGKTTVAKALSKILFNAGIIKEDKLIEVEKKDLVGQYIGHTEKNVKEILEKAKGGILFIDEAYTLATGGDNDFGKHVIDGILTAMTENKCIIIVAGYPKQMEEFLQTNPGLKSRFTKHIHLENYKPDELFCMFKNLCTKSNFILEDEQIIKEMLCSHFEQKLNDSNFGNGRYVKTIFDEVMEERSELLPEDSTKEERLLIKVLYIQKVLEKY